MDRPSPAPPLLLPRSLIFLASIWLIASWILAMGLRTPIQPVSASYTPGVRLMLVYVTIGLLVAWPLMRLSQSRMAYPIRQTLLDLFVLLALVQVVVWPLRLVTAWAPLRTAAMDATIVFWTGLAGVLVAAGGGAARPWARNVAMLGCLVMCLFGPLAAWLGLVAGVDAMDLLDVSPVMAIYRLSRGGGAPPSIGEWNVVVALGATCVSSWLLLAIGQRVAASRRAG